MRKLIRFVDNKAYAEEFISGSVFMNYLGYFWEQGFEDQKDLFEGLSYQISPSDFKDLEQELIDVLAHDPAIRIDAYKYCNICSFYRLDVDETRKIIELPNPRIDEFGEYAIIILDEKEFLSRIFQSMRKYPEWSFLSGDVSYPKTKDRSDLEGGVKHTLDLILNEKVDLSTILSKNKRFRSRDLFTKKIKYDYQKEWRICLWKNDGKEESYKFEVGDLSDISKIVKTEDLRQTLLKSYEGYKIGQVHAKIKPYQGTISRKEFRKKVAHYDGKAWIMLTIG